jgi:hypothetical protein
MRKDYLHSPIRIHGVVLKHGHNVICIIVVILTFVLHTPPISSLISSPQQ